MNRQKRTAELRNEIARRRGPEAQALLVEIEDEVERELEHEAKLEADSLASERAAQQELDRRKRAWIADGGTGASWEDQLTIERDEYLKKLARQSARRQALAWGQRRRRQAIEDAAEEARRARLARESPLERTARQAAQFAGEVWNPPGAYSSSESWMSRLFFGTVIGGPVVFVVLFVALLVSQHL